MAESVDCLIYIQQNVCSARALCTFGETEAGRGEATCQESDSERQQRAGLNSGLALSGYSVQIIKDNRFQRGDQRPASLFTKRNPH